MNKMSIVLSCILLFCCSTVRAYDGPPEPELDNNEKSTAVNTPIEVDARIEILLRGGYKYTTYENGQPLLQSIVKHLTDKNLPGYIVIPVVSADGEAMGEVLLLKSEIVAVTRRVIKEEVKSGDNKILERLLGPGMKEKNSFR